MNKNIELIIEGLSKTLISDNRQGVLDVFLDALCSSYALRQKIDVVFVCTHNSRRSVFCQVWFQTLADYFGIDVIESYSGGTEKTKVAKPVIRCLKKQGFLVEANLNLENPIYSIQSSEGGYSLKAFSKVYTDAFNPQENYIAVMVCSDADKNCPIIRTSEKRVAITFDDPKLFDNTDLESEKYEDKSIEIATELYYVLSKLKNKL